MGNNAYKIISKFKCCGNTMVTVIMEEKAACVMSQNEFERMIRAERKYYKNEKLRVA